HHQYRLSPADDWRAGIWRLALHTGSPTATCGRRAYADGTADRDADLYPQPDVAADMDTDANMDQHADGNTDRRTDGNTDAHADHDADRDGNAVADADTVGHADDHANAVTRILADAACNRHAAAIAVPVRAAKQPDCVYEQFRQHRGLPVAGLWRRGL